MRPLKLERALAMGIVAVATFNTLAAVPARSRSQTGSRIARRGGGGRDASRVEVAVAHDVVGNRASPVLTRAMWLAVVLLVIIGVAAAIGRSVFIDDLTVRADPVRAQAMKALHRDDPFAAERPAEMARVDSRYAAHPRLILLHVLTGAIFLLLAPFQFSKRIRSRHIRIHRWAGRTLLVLALLGVPPGLYFGIRTPFAGAAETVVIAIVGGVFFTALIQGYLAIRRRQVARHREWMIRLFATAIGISTVRVVAAVVDISLTPAGFRPTELFILSLWTGWLLTLGVAELWIRYTRPREVFRVRGRMPGELIADG